MERKPLTTYQALSTLFYDLELQNDTSGALAFYWSYAKSAQGMILEPMCGTGRFLVPFLQAGLAIEGFDASAHMLAALKKKCASLGLENPPVWQQFVQDFTSSKRYHLIFIPFGSWGLITNQAEAYHSLVNLYSHLAPDGKLILEIETVNSVPYPCDIWRRGIHKKDAVTTIAINTFTTYNSSTQLFSARCHYELIQNSIITQEEAEVFDQYLFRNNELDELLKTIGFRAFYKYQNYQKAEATSTTAPVLIYECIK